MSDNQQFTLVLLPGLDGTGSLFRPFLSALSGHVCTHVIAYPVDKLLSLSEYAEFVKSQLPRGRLVVLAESFSGLVALALLSLCREHIDAILFCGCFAQPPRPFVLKLLRFVPRPELLLRVTPIYFLRLFCVGSQASKTCISSLRTAISRVSPDVLMHRLWIIATEEFAGLDRHEVPCYYLQAKQDRLVPSWTTKWFERHFSCFHLEQIDGPHFLLQAKPQECANRVEMILAKIRSGN